MYILKWNIYSFQFVNNPMSSFLACIIYGFTWIVYLVCPQSQRWWARTWCRRERSWHRTQAEPACGGARNPYQVLTSYDFFLSQKYLSIGLLFGKNFMLSEVLQHYRETKICICIFSYSGFVIFRLEPPYPFKWRAPS